MDRKLILPVVCLVILIVLFSRFLAPLLQLLRPNLNLLPNLNLPTAVEFTLVVASMPFLALIAAVFTLPISVILVYVHRLIKLDKYEYSAVPLGSGYGIYDILKRGVMPGLFCWAIGLQNAFVGRPSSLPPALEGNPELARLVIAALQVTELPLSFSLALLLVPVAALLWSPVWFLEDSGVVTSLKTAELEKRKTPDTEGLGRYYNSYLNGFVGLTTILVVGRTFLSLILLNLSVIIDASTRADLARQAMITMGFNLLIPVYVVLAFAPFLLVHEYLLPALSSRLIGFLKGRKLISGFESAPDVEHVNTKV